MPTKLLSLADVESKLTVIKHQARDGDNEAAHRKQEELYIAVLRTIAAGGPNASELAKSALRSQRVKFKRYFA